MMSVSLPPIKVPTSEPIPNEDIIQPTSESEKFKSSVRYNDKKGITIVPDLFIKVMSDNHHTSLDNPEKVFTYFVIIFFMSYVMYFK